MKELNNEQMNMENPIDNKYLQEQRLDDNIVNQEDIIENTVTRETIDFDKISKNTTNEMVEISSLESSKDDIENQFIENTLTNQEVFNNSDIQKNEVNKVENNNLSFQQPIISQPQPQFMTNGGLTIHSTQKEEKKKMSTKSKKTLLFSIGTVVVLLFVICGVLGLKSMGIIGKPTIDEIYENYNYNYTNGVTKFIYDGNEDFYFIENDIGFDIVSIKDSNMRLSVIANANNYNLDDVKTNFESISNENSFSESSEIIKINHKNYETSINSNTYNVLSKEIIVNNENLIVSLQYNSNIDENDIEFKTMKQIYTTMIFNN